MQFLVRIIIYRIIVRRAHWLRHWLSSTVAFDYRVNVVHITNVHHVRSSPNSSTILKMSNSSTLYTSMCFFLSTFNAHVPRMTNYMETSEAPGFRPVRPGGRNSNKRRSPMLVIPLETKDFSELFAQNCPSSSFVMPSFDDSSNRVISHVSVRRHRHPSP